MLRLWAEVDLDVREAGSLPRESHVGLLWFEWPRVSDLNVSMAQGLRKSLAATDLLAGAHNAKRNSPKIGRSSFLKAASFASQRSILEVTRWVSTSVTAMKFNG